ncbi:MAG TPA: DoxX family protein [Mucilaginibacter sp.]|nr:DoxX family protein [Mucilaginibacter sp.]
MKANKITYWVTTAIVAIMMTYSCYAYLTQPAIKQAFQHLGFPDYFRVELAIAKLIAAVILLTPVAARIKEWAYAGLSITFISAFIAHTASGDPANYRAMPLIFLALLVVSYITYHKLASNTITKQ